MPNVFAGKSCFLPKKTAKGLATLAVSTERDVLYAPKQRHCTVRPLLLLERRCQLSKPTVKPGATVPDSGIYKSSISHTRSTMVQGEPAPPTPKKGEVWKQIINTNP
jgi:hypothetical protein